ncbi:hypothetical protein Lser_V15G26888 [Lactuca serriola]
MAMFTYSNVLLFIVAVAFRWSVEKNVITSWIQKVATLVINDVINNFIK